MLCLRGHLDVMSLRRPIADLLRGLQVPETERKPLAKVLDIRSFAINDLGLPNNGSNRLYANIDRPYVAGMLSRLQNFP